MYKHTFCLITAKCWFCSLVPVVKCAHCRQYDLACLSVANNTNTRDCIVGNGHILPWDLMSEINILQSWDKSMFVHARSGAPKIFAKFGWKIWTFCHKKMEKAWVRQTITLIYISHICFRTRRTVISYRAISRCSWRTSVSRRISSWHPASLWLPWRWGEIFFTGIKLFTSPRLSPQSRYLTYPRYDF